MKDLYTKNKIFLKENKEGTNNRKTYHIHVYFTTIKNTQYNERL